MWGSLAGGFSYDTPNVEQKFYWNCGNAAGSGYKVCNEKTGSLYGDRGAGWGTEKKDHQVD